MSKMREQPTCGPGWEVISDRDRAYVYCLKHMSLSRTPGQKGICLVRDEKVVAAVCYDWFTGSNFFIHVAAEPGKRWLNRSFLYWCFHYPFVQQRVSRLTGWVEANNLAARRFDESLGFKLEATLKGAGTDGQDVCLYVMHREDCRYV
ncbi:MAG: N-acetyltransferase [Caldimonas sp.]